jgi:hypothetical protein
MCLVLRVGVQFYSFVVSGCLVDNKLATAPSNRMMSAECTQGLPSSVEGVVPSSGLEGELQFQIPVVPVLVTRHLLVMQ